jgi:hypothetical protein
MNICRDRHEKICYVGTNCPLCAMRREIENMIEGYIVELGALLEIINTVRKEEEK